jgi:hypothetical protein
MADAPTSYPELNHVLTVLVDGAREVLGGCFLGAYLHGSFAIGDADEFSDVDFVVATHDVLTDPQVSGISNLHQRIFTLPTVWAQHLEGSYIPADALREVDAGQTQFAYFDNGSTALAWSDHDNTAIMRWSLRERGITLVGPEPATLINPVTRSALIAEVIGSLRDRARFLHDHPADLDNGWVQPYIVLTFCRGLHTISVGAVTSKPAAGKWAIDALDARWHPLIRRALADRPDPSERARRPAEQGVLAETWAFVDDVVGSLPGR